jgi:hypothetical protein
MALVKGGSVGTGVLEEVISNAHQMSLQVILRRRDWAKPTTNPTPHRLPSPQKRTVDAARANVQPLWRGVGVVVVSGLILLGSYSLGWGRVVVWVGA